MKRKILLIGLLVGATVQASEDGIMTLAGQTVGFLYTDSGSSMTVTVYTIDEPRTEASITLNNIPSAGDEVETGDPDAAMLLRSSIRVYLGVFVAQRLKDILSLQSESSEVPQS